MIVDAHLFWSRGCRSAGIASERDAFGRGVKRRAEHSRWSRTQTPARPLTSTSTWFAGGFVSRRRSRRKLARTYITNTLEISSGEEVQDLGADTFLETVEAGWGAEVPEPLDKMLRTVVLVFFAPGSCAETAIYWALPPPRPDTYGSG